MIKFLKKQIDWNLVELSALLSLIYCVLFNTPILLHKYNLYKATFGKAIIELGKDLIFTYSIVFILFFGLCIRKSILYGGTFILFLTGAAASYYVYNFNLPITSENIRTIFENDFSEINEMVSLKVIAWVCFSLFVSLYTIFYYKYQDTKTYFSKILIVGCFIISFYNIISPPYKIMKAYFPYKYLNNTYIYFEGKFKKKLIN